MLTNNPSHTHNPTHTQPLRPYTIIQAHTLICCSLQQPTFIAVIFGSQANGNFKYNGIREINARNTNALALLILVLNTNMN